MREIKFRAKKEHWNEFDNPLWNKWQYANGYYFDGINYWFTLPSKDNPAIAWAKQVSVDIKTLGEFTGLKDKNGIEIYEGELVEYPVTSFPLEVAWDDFSCGFVLRHSKYKIIKMPSEEAMAEYSLSIGNIYENKELLEAKKD